MIASLLDSIWTPGIRENTIVTIIVGGPLSIYLAIIVNRLATFRQLKLSAILEIALLSKTTLDTDSAMKGQIAVRGFMEVPPIAMKAEHQDVAAHELKTIRRELRTYFLNELYGEMAKRELSKFSDLKGDEWINAQSEIYSRARLVLKSAVERIQRLQPDYGQILMLGHVDHRWLRRSDCSSCCENCKRVL